MRRPKPSSEAEQQYNADVALAERRAEFLEAAREAEDRLRQAQARHAPVTELHRLAEELDAALTAAVRAAYAARRAAIGPLGYDDRIYGARRWPSRTCTPSRPKLSTCSRCARTTA